MITTRNEEWGFFGTYRRNLGIGDEAAAIAFDAAAREFASLYKVSDEEARDVLDARIGRHLADRVTSAPSFDRDSCESIQREVLKAAIDWRHEFRKTLRAIQGFGSKP